MLTTLRDLLRFSLSFRFGLLILLLVAAAVLTSFFAPFPPERRREVPRKFRGDPPSAQYVLGTTALGQDVFWMTVTGIRNTLVIAGIAVLVGRGIGVMLGMISGYLGGTADRIIQSVVESVIVIPRLPLLILIAVILAGELTFVTLGLLIGLLDWAYPSKRYRAQVLSLREREFTHTAIFSGMSTVKIVLQEHLPFITPFLLADVVSGFVFSIGIEVTLSYLGLNDLNELSLGTQIYWANEWSSLFAGKPWVMIAPVVSSIVVAVGFYLVSIGISEYLDPRKRLLRLQTPVEDGDAAATTKKAT
ncbi:MAG: ABC transporter permease [Chloroflexi bacterium]|nr:ABC transporter permease [Chloroflexota bacterium]MCY4247704.1 ABC transporter permease [Chloroflexota bacterium]